ncbi:MAG: B12-binding domain-containing radical SAM protein [Candidatus Hodarchaeota archaeon]
MRIVLADPPKIKDQEKYSPVTGYPNIGILSMVSYLRKYLDEVECIYLEIDSLKAHLEQIKNLKPDVYGISFASYMNEVSYLTLNKVREILGKEAILLSGGVHPTALPEEVLDNSETDACIIGEGEETLHEFISSILRGNDWRSIPGIAYRDGKNEIIRTKPRHFLKPEKIPMPAWDLIDFERYGGVFISKGKPSTCILFSRGCPYNCTFCSNPVWRSSRPWLRTRTPESICEEIEYLYKCGIRELYIRADEFNSRLDWTMQVCRAIKSLNLKDLYFQCNLRADKINEELASGLRDMNCWLVHLGIESMNQRVLDGIKKQITVEDVLNACDILKKNDIQIYGFMMFYNAWEENSHLCYETPEEVNNTIRQALKLKRKGWLDYMSWQFATPYPGSDLYRIAKKYNLIEKNKKKSGQVWDLNMVLPGISKRQMSLQRLKGLLLQTYCYWRAGNINWKFWKNAVLKIRYIFKSLFEK